MNAHEKVNEIERSIKEEEMNELLKETVSKNPQLTFKLIKEIGIREGIKMGIVTGVFLTVFVVLIILIIK